MRIGISFPQTEIGSDPVAIRDLVQAAEELGYDYVTITDHVIQGGKPVADDWRAYYVRDNMFHEPFVLMGYLAGQTSRIEFATAILILSQRQTVLVAKQAAEVDVLSQGRLRLGVGIGWNELEFNALNENFRDRGRRVEEQMDVLRALWSNELVTYDGEWHKITDAGINPLPVQRPIPLWIGAFQEAAVERAGRLADGWFMNPRMEPDDAARRELDVFHAAAAKAGRDANALGLDATVFAHEGSENVWVDKAEAWRAFGISHLTFRTMENDLKSAEEHIQTIRRFKEVYPS